MVNNLIFIYRTALHIFWRHYTSLLKVKNFFLISENDIIKSTSIFSLEDIYKLEYRPVFVKGYFLHDKELYIGPRSLLLKGDASTQSTLVTGKGNTSHGYLVITPFKLADRKYIEIC